MSAENFPPTEQKPTSHRSLRGAVVLATAALVAAACSSPEANNGGKTPTPVEVSAGASPATVNHNTPPAESYTQYPTPTQACRLPGARFESSIRTQGGAVQLSRFLVGSSIDMAPHTTDGECYEQVTFRFNGMRVAADSLPGVHARYVPKPVRQKPSDIAVKVAGKAYLEVDIGTWWGQAGGSDGPRTITDPDVDNVQVVQQTQNFEGVSTWVVGLDEKQPFTITPVSGTPGCPDLCYALKVQTD